MEEKTQKILFLAVFFTHFFTVCISQRSDRDESAALLSFRSQITIDPSRILRNWSSSPNGLICNWAGVSCNSNQRVMSLNLSGYNLVGTIAPHLGNLTFLTSLDISYNNFSGSIPKELSNLQNLKEIYLGDNQLTGSIPSGLFSLPSLETIDLTKNSLSGNLSADICSSSSSSSNNSSKLKELLLSENLLEGTIPPELYKCSGLEILQLGTNQFIGSIPRELGFLSNLRELVISNNNITGLYCFTA